VQGLQEKFRVAPVTVSLSAVCVAVYGLEALLISGARAPDFSWWALSGDGLARGRWWTLVTHLFLHANMLHLMANVLALWFVGPEVEWMLGRVKFLALYFLSGVAGGLLQTAFAAPTSELIGASGAVCGLLLSFTTAYPEMPLRALLFFVLPVKMKARTLGWGLIVVSVLCVALRILPQIGHLAHLGGALTGAVLTWWWLPAAPRRRAVGEQKEVRSAATEELLARVVEEGMDGLSREERRRLEGLAEETKRRW
jgi:membrane associated rhomboid family serine protease